jgi:hypothetical protein
VDLGDHVNIQIIQWAIRNRVSEQALSELRGIFALDAPAIIRLDPHESEAAVQSLVRLEASRKGLHLWRNNVGALLDSRGVRVRYGLANDSAQLNKRVKSGDLIGWRPVLITEAHIGSKIAQFVSRECKRPDWKYSGDDHEKAQLRWAEAICADGGDACFATGEETL